MQRTIFNLVAGLVLSFPVYSADEIVVYSERKEHLIKPLFEAYTAETGVPIRYITDNAALLIERIAAEGESTPADLLMTVDAGNLWQAKERGILAPVESELLEERVPAHLRDPDRQWFGLSQRARTIVYSSERVDPAELSDYAGLADPEWRGRVCLRTAQKVYNQSLVATLIERLGEPETEAIVEGWVANLAAPVFTSDTRLLEAIAAGQCDVGIVNTYYLGRLVKDDPDFPVRVFWANQDGAGVHVNISGAGVLRHADNAAGATRLLEWLAGPEAQADFAGLNLEYPVLEATQVDPVLEAWGDFEADPVNLEVAGRRQAQAVKLMDRAGYR
ncbi:MAG: extracellular solute-binding protein [Xanthomonadales bacterium]|nr:extracellular solute-binding protein [Xanthomonadales bacterium]